MGFCQTAFGCKKIKISGGAFYHKFHASQAESSFAVIITKEAA